jgi:uncharacterized membrane protein YbaN (DUF454 family)
MMQQANADEMTRPAPGGRPAAESCPVFRGEIRRPAQTASGIAVARSRAVRWWLVAVGVACVALGAVGVVVPGLPTTVFLIIASWCFVRSCPVLERVLIRNRFFSPFVRYLQPGAVMPTKARVLSTIAIWAAVLPGGWLLAERGVPGLVVGVVLLSAAIGTIAVWRIARAAPAASARA